MNQITLVKELRELTQAGMKDCKDALVETNWDLQAAVDVVKAKGLANTSRNSHKPTSEGALSSPTYIKTAKRIAMCEVQCETDFTAKSPLFIDFVEEAGRVFVGNFIFDIDTDFTKDEKLEEKRKEVMAKTKENITIKRWWVVEVQGNNRMTFAYRHSNKLTTIYGIEAPTEEALQNEEFRTLVSDLGMQITAMNPLAVSVEFLKEEDIERQKGIFETQLKEAKKPEATWAKILDGKFKKWHTDVCLLEQESILHPKKTVKQVIDEVASKLGGEIKVLTFVRAQVGEGIEVAKTDFAADVAALAQ